jgi:hypothetical protein
VPQKQLDSEGVSSHGGNVQRSALLPILYSGVRAGLQEQRCARDCAMLDGKMQCRWWLSGWGGLRTSHPHLLA